MNSIEITAALLQGSKNIDRMREETRQLISIVLGFALKPLENGARFDETFTSSDYDYEWTTFFTKGPTGFLEVKCSKKNSDDTILFVHVNDRCDSPAKHVQVVYESLPVFVEGMMKKFPHIIERWQFLINASQVKFY